MRITGELRQAAKLVARTMLDSEAAVLTKCMNEERYEHEFLSGREVKESAEDNLSAVLMDYFEDAVIGEIRKLKVDAVISRGRVKYIVKEKK